MPAVPTSSYSFQGPVASLLRCWECHSRPLDVSPMAGCESAADPPKVCGVRQLAITLVAISFLNAGVLTKTAMAQGHAGVPSDGADEGLLSHIRSGRIARDGGRWREAERAYKAALATDTERMTEALRAEVTGELGLCELALARPRDAAEHLAESLDHRGLLDPMTERRFEDGQRRAEAHVERLYLGVNPQDAEVLLDGKPIPRRGRSFVLFLEPGYHTIRARLLGHGPAFQAFESVAGKERTMSLALTRAPDPAPLVTAITRAPTPAAEPSWSTATTLRTVGFILTATTAAAGLTSLISAAVVHGEITDRVAELRASGTESDACLRPDAARFCSELHDAQERKLALSRFGLGSLIASGAIGLVTAGSFALEPSEPIRAGGVRVMPLAGDQAGLMLYGVW